MRAWGTGISAKQEPEEEVAYSRGSRGDGRRQAARSRSRRRTGGNYDDWEGKGGAGWSYDDSGKGGFIPPPPAWDGGGSNAKSADTVLERYFGRDLASMWEVFLDGVNDKGVPWHMAMGKGAGKGSFDGGGKGKGKWRGDGKASGGKGGKYGSRDYEDEPADASSLDMDLEAYFKGTKEMGGEKKGGWKGGERRKGKGRGKDDDDRRGNKDKEPANESNLDDQLQQYMKVNEKKTVDAQGGDESSKATEKA